MRRVEITPEVERAAVEALERLGPPVEPPGARYHGEHWARTTR